MSEPRIDEELKDPLPDDYVLHAHDVCPHIWSIIEDAGVFGYLNVSAAKRQIVSCDQCLRDVFRLAEEGVASVDLPGPLSFLIGQLMERIKQEFP